MSEIETQLRGYFDAAVDRVTPGDILAGQRVFERFPQRRRAWSPAWAAIGSFLGTVVVLGGAVAFGAVLNQPNAAVSSGGVTEVIGEATKSTSGWWVLIPGIGLAIGVVGTLVVKNQHHRIAKEDAMTATIERPTEERSDIAERKNNRRLIFTVVALAVALVALGAWVLYDQAAEPATAAPAAVQELLDDYTAAWNDFDGDTFLALVTEDYSFSDSERTSGATVMASEIRGINRVFGLEVERVGDLAAIGDGPYYVSTVVRITGSSASGNAFENIGASSWLVVDTAAGLKVAAQTVLVSTS